MSFLTQFRQVALPSRKSDEYTVAWITDSLGRDVAGAILDHEDSEPWDYQRTADDRNAYVWGQIGDHNVVVASATERRASITTTVHRVLASFPFVRFGLLVGTAAGYPKPDQGKDIRLGDVVVGRTDKSGGLVQYNLEAIKGHESRGPADVLHKAPNLLISTLDKLHRDYYAKKTSIQKIVRYRAPDDGKDRLFSPNYAHAGETSCDQCDPDQEIFRGSRDWTEAHVFYGTIAAGDMVVRDTATRDLIENHIGDDCICFDRASVGLMSEFPCLVIRGISRYADSHLNSEKWKYHAMANASAYTKLFLRRLAAPQVRNLRKVVKVRGFQVRQTPRWNPKVCKMCLNLQYMLSQDEGDIPILVHRLFSYQAPCIFCKILRGLFVVLTKEISEGFAPAILFDQSELHVLPPRGRALIVKLGHRTVPKRPGSPRNRADNEDSRREIWMGTDSRTPGNAEDEDKEDDVEGQCFGEMSSIDKLDLIDMRGIICTAYVEKAFNAESNDRQTAPDLCMCYIASGDLHSTSPKIAAESTWIGSMIGSTHSTDFIRTSIEECERKSGKSHHNCLPSHESPLPTRVLDVRDGMVKLIDNSVGVRGKYCTLSYRWGPPEFNFRTVRANLDQMRKCVPWDEVPPLIQDAVTITRQLNVPYLWIDAFCIIQEDEGDWSNEYPLMGSYYQNAYVTICPSFAEDVRQPFIQPRRLPQVRTIDQMLADRKSQSNGQTDSGFPMDLMAGHRMRSRTSQLVAKPTPDPEPVVISFCVPEVSGVEITLHARMPNTLYHPSIMAASPLAQRGWMWQENVLSARIAHFTPWEVVFECRSAQRFEYTDDVYLKTGLCCSFAEFGSNPEQSWKQHVSLFSEKALTYESDRLPAISGVAEIVGRSLKGPYLAGAWADWLDTDLLWYPDNIPRPFGYDMAPVAKSSLTIPSWSWASMTTTARFPVLYNEHDRKLRLVHTSYQPSGSSAYGPTEEYSYLTLRGYTFRAEMQAENAFDLDCYSLRLPSAMESSVAKLQLRPDGMLRSGRISIPDGEMRVVTRVDELLAPPTEDEERKARDNAKVKQKLEIERLTVELLTLAEKGEKDGDSHRRFSNNFPKKTVLETQLRKSMWTMMAKKPKMVPILLPTEVICLLLTEQVAKNFPEAFTKEELKLYHVDLQYKDPHEIDLFISTMRTDGRPRKPDPAVLNQWYLILGHSDGDIPTCWRVGVLNMQLSKRIQLERTTLYLT